MDEAFCVVPVQGEAKVPFVFPIDCVVVVVGNDTDQVVGVFFADVFDAEVVDYELETDWAPRVRPET